MAIDAAGNVYTTGRFGGTVDFDPGAGTANLSAVGLTDVFVHKLDANGNFVWAKAFGGSTSDYGMSIALDATGNIYTTGRFEGTVDFDPGAGTNDISSVGSGDVFIQKLDPSGNFLWAKTFGDASLDFALSIKVDAGGNIYTTGRFEGTVDFDPGIGTTALTSVGAADVFVQKMDETGNFLWAKAFGGNSVDGGTSIDVDALGNIYLTGYFQNDVDFDPGAGIVNLGSGGGYDIFVLKLDVSGDYLWAKTFGDASNDYGYFITIDAAGNTYTTGKFGGNTDFDPGSGTVMCSSVGLDDIFIQKMDALGDFQWVRTFGGIFNEEANSIAVDASESIYLTGRFQNLVDFDPGAGTDNRSAAGDSDIFIHKMSACSSTTGTDTRTECSPYTWIDGNVYTASNNTASFNFVAGAANGCDSIVTLELTIMNPSYGIDTRTECSPYTWIDGNTYTANNNTATYTIVGAAPNGCDSIITLDLTILNTPSSTDVIIACSSYTWIDGNTYTTSNNTATYNFVGGAASGCDSLVTLDLTINNVTEITTNTSGNMISSNNILADYQWLDCNNNYAVISGETSASFTPSANGSYAVELTENGCVDTSECVTIASVGILENHLGSELTIYPNPTKGKFSVDLGSIFGTIEIRLTDINGKLIYTDFLTQEDSFNLSINESAGLYILSILADNRKAIIRMVKE